MKYLIAIFSLMTCMPIEAQSYFTAGGVRLGTENGLTIQQRIFKNTTLEGIVLSGFKSDDLSAGILIQKHYPLLFKNFNVLTGVGYQTKRENQVEFGTNQYHGAALQGGIELTIGRFNVAWDYKPVIYFDAPRSFQSESGISLRYVFITNRDIKKWERKRKRNQRKKEEFDWFGLKKNK